MALYGIVSAGGSPGATTTALALALTWPREVILAECDPAGGSVLAGFLADRLSRPPGPGLLGLAMEVADRPRSAARLENYTIPLADHGGGSLLHGIRDPRHGQQIAALWRPLAQTFRSASTDVIIDLGRIGGLETPYELLADADLVVMVLHRSLVQIHAAQPRLTAVQELLGGQVPVGLCLIDSGPYSAGAVQEALSGPPVFAELPLARSDARVLSDGDRPPHAFHTSLLMRAVGTLGHEMRKAVEERAFHPGGSPPVRSGRSR